MRKGLTLVIVLMIASPAASWAQQANGSTPNRGLGSGTPGVAVGTTGTTYATPGVEQKQPVPGGGIPMGAATQDTSNLSSDPSNFNNGGGSNDR
jgi:hypothetical protein